MIIRARYFLLAVVCSLFLLSGCFPLIDNFNRDTLNEVKVVQAVNRQLVNVEYQAYIAVGSYIGASAVEPELFLKQLGLVDYAVRQGADRTWYVTSKLTEKGKEILKPVKTTWGLRYTATVAKLQIQRVSSIAQAEGTAEAELTLKVVPTDSLLAKYLSPEKYVQDNYNIHIEYVDSTGSSKINWGVPQNRPYKVQLKKYSDGWKVEKIIKH